MLSILLFSFVAQIPDLPSEWDARVTAHAHLRRDDETYLGNADANFHLLGEVHAAEHVSFIADLSLASGNPYAPIVDMGSLVGIRWADVPSKRAVQLSLAPLSAARLRVGRYEPLVLRGDLEGTGAQAIALDASAADYHAFAWGFGRLGAYGAAIERNPELLTGVLGGIGLAPEFGLSANLAAIRFGYPDVDTSVTTGAGLRTKPNFKPSGVIGGHLDLGYRNGRVSKAIDFALHSNDATVWDAFFDDTGETVGSAIDVGLEANVARLRLAESVAPNPATFSFPKIVGERTGFGAAAAVNARVNAWRVHAAASLRSASYAAWSSTWATLRESFLGTGDETAELMGLGLVEYRFQRWNLQPGLGARVVRPATFADYPGRVGPLPFALVVVPDSGPPVYLEYPTHVELRWDVKGTVRWEPIPALGFIGELTYSRDPNASKLEDDGAGVPHSKRTVASRVLINVLAQARF